MSRRWLASSGTAARALIALAAVLCFSGVAYAATRPGHGTSGESEARPPRPRLTERPARVTPRVLAQFGFSIKAHPRQAAPRFECRLDEGAWARCVSPIRLPGLKAGTHRFSVRAVNRQGRPGRRAAYAWEIERKAHRPVQQPPESLPAAPAPEPTPPTPTDGKPFSIEPDLTRLAPLYPGTEAQPLPVALTNPNDETIFVTGVSVAIDPEPAGCPADNFRLTPAGASEEDPVTIGAGETVTLPAQGIAAPAIAMLDLPISQDSCQSTQLPLRFEGEAHG